MEISNTIREAVARVFENREEDDREYTGTITHHELKEAAYLVGNIKKEITYNERSKEKT